MPGSDWEEYQSRFDPRVTAGLLDGLLQRGPLPGFRPVSPTGQTLGPVAGSRRAPLDPFGDYGDQSQFPMMTGGYGYYNPLIGMANAQTQRYGTEAGITGWVPSDLGGGATWEREKGFTERMLDWWDFLQGLMRDEQSMAAKRAMQRTRIIRQMGPGFGNLMNLLGL